jgi:hypothetical protein
LLAQLLAAVLPGGKGAVVMLRAYFDESGTHEGAPALIVAGYLFEPESCVTLEREWSAALCGAGVSVFHAKDSAHFLGEFKGMSREERDSLYVGLLGLIKRHVVLGVAVSVPQDVFDRLKPKGWEAKFGGAYAVCATLCLQAVGRWCRENSPDERVAYFFEAGHESAAEANRFMQHVVRHPFLAEEYRYNSHTFIPKRDAIPLQAADILAWGWNKELTEGSVRPRKRPTRKSLLSLRGRPPHVMFRLETGNLPRYLAQMMET